MGIWKELNDGKFKEGRDALCGAKLAPLSKRQIVRVISIGGKRPHEIWLIRLPLEQPAEIEISRAAGQESYFPIVLRGDVVPHLVDRNMAHTSDFSRRIRRRALRKGRGSRGLSRKGHFVADSKFCSLQSVKDVGSNSLLKCAVRKDQNSSGRERQTHPEKFAPAGSSRGGC